MENRHFNIYLHEVFHEVNNNRGQNGTQARKRRERKRKKRVETPVRS